MSAVHIPRVLSQRGKTQVEIDRENYEKTQSVGIQKAVNAQETPVKEKHARTAVIGTHQEHGSSMFWAVTTKLQLQGNPIVCWKFCQVLHKLMRDGHSQVIVDSQKYTSLITDLGKMWGHLKEGYGKLIAFYTKLLVQKLGFHKKNPSIPGNLMLREGMLDRICSNDINSYFELSVDMLDYMDDILALQATVYGSLDMSRSNSMTNSGQCRLAPLIMCIQDSCQLYDFLVNILFKLHSSLPPDTLSGHRTRFYQQYKSLKQFYCSSGNLQYFKNLIKVPLLPDDPPNFLRAADLSSHVKPVVVVPDPEPEIEEIPEPEPKLDMLVDTSAAPTAFGENGAASPPVPDEKDLMISQLLQEVNQLKRDMSRLREEMIRMQEEDQAVQESLENRIKELEMELYELRQIAESTTLENEALKTALSEEDTNSEAAANIAAVEKVAKGNEEKFRKMKDIYAKLREEHVQLLRQQAEVKKQLTDEARSKRELDGKHSDLSQELAELKAEKSKVLSTLQQSATDSAVQLAAVDALNDKHEHEKQDLGNRIHELESERAEHKNNMEKCQTDVNVLRADLQKTISDKDSLERQLTDLMQQSRSQLLAGAIKEGQHIIRDALDQADNPHHSTVTCAAEYLLNRSQPARDSLADLRRAYGNYHTDKNDVGDVIGKISEFSHHLGNVIVLGFATSHSVTIEPGEELTGRCQGVGDKSISLLGLLKGDDLSAVSDQSNKVDEIIQQIMIQAEQLLPKIEDVEAEQLVELVDQEMQMTSKAIEKAAARIADMLANSREAQSGIQLEVNEGILDSCTSLMMAIKILIQKAKVLQQEIAERGRGTSSAREFYKKHHRWTEGLISAAKAVGLGASVLVEAADKVVKGDGKFEELIVCSQEIAASTVQLVVSSKVKAEKGSTKLTQLSSASKGVSEATGQVVAAAKSGAQKIEDLDILDFSNITLHQAKRQEMESQVRLLELESEIERERVRLASLRKTHYQLAGESEGWDQEEIDGDAESPTSKVPTI